EKPVQESYQRNTVCLIAKAPLGRNSKYTAQVKARVNGAEFQRTWSFTTGSDGDMPQDELEAKVLERVNAHRQAAGLAPVLVADPELARACKAHCNYLVKNAGHPSVQGAGMHEEDPKLPGYSAEGHRAGQASVIAYVDPLTSVDEW